MTIRECYEAMGSDFDGVLRRLGSEAIISKFAVKFLNDPSFPELKSAMQDKRAEDAFRAAHTLKGVCLNLGFDRLHKVSSELTEQLRDRTFEGTDELYKLVEEEYAKTISALSEFSRG